MRCAKLPQLAESVPLATPLARFGKSVRTASKQRVVCEFKLSRLGVHPDRAPTHGVSPYFETVLAVTIRSGQIRPSNRSEQCRLTRVDGHVAAIRSWNVPIDDCR